MSLNNEQVKKKFNQKKDDIFQLTIPRAIDDRRGELENLARKYRNLESVHNLQKNTVRHCMHNVMSPLSAVSGYIELLTSNLGDGADPRKIERYSQKINEGLNEVGFLLELLQDMYRSDQENEEINGQPVVELNWLAGEVSEIINNSSELRAAHTICINSDKPVHLHAELFQLKLIIYTLVTIADKFSSENSRIEIEITKKEGQAALIINCNSEPISREGLQKLLQRNETGEALEELNEDLTVMTGIKTCSQMIEQIQGAIKVVKKESGCPVFILTAPAVSQEEFYCN